MKVVTSGSPYLDIDAYAGCIAYAELLNLLGEKAIAASSAPLNESITPEIRAWGADLNTDYVPTEHDTFILIDISDQEVFDKFVVPERIEEIIDHHMEFVDYWQRKLGSKSHIEFIGAACTLVYELWVQAGRLENISELSARLLIAGILDNTLNFEADVTTGRDRTAYAELMEHAHLATDWPAQYFAACQQTIMNGLSNAIANDIKFVEFPSLKGKLATGQLVVWNAKVIVEDHIADVQRSMAAISAKWFINIVSIEEGKNYLLGDESSQAFLENLLDVKFINSIVTTNRLWLRKEIIKRDLDAQS